MTMQTCAETNSLGEPALTTDNEPEDATPGRWAARVGAWVAPAGAFALWLAPIGCEPDAHALLALAWAVLVAWVTEVIPLAVTALLIAPALVVLGISPAKQAFSAYADPILFLFVGSFFAAAAMARHGLDRRIAATISGLQIIAGRPTRLRGAVVLAAMLLSMWMSNTGTTAMLLPVLLGMLRQPGAHGSGTFAAGSVLALAHASTTGGLATLVGTPPNAITARILGKAGFDIGFLDWMRVGVPTMLLMTAAVFAVVQRGLPADDGTRLGAQSAARAEPWTRAQRATCLSFALMVFGWVLPDLLKLTGAPWANVLATRLEPGAVALLGASVLFMVPVARGGERVLPWSAAVQIEWGLVFLFGGGIALGEAMFQTGLAKVLGEGFIEVTGVSGLWSLTAATTALAIVLTEFCSNTAAANMLVPLVIGAASQLGVSPVPPALAAGLGASCGFMLPVATGANALVYGTGKISSGNMMRIGVLIDALAFVVIFSMLRLLCPLFGWG
jgi:sodium-dependent dicarboxylate transporter 2/3/5